jgi:hypothetical protein
MVRLMFAGGIFGNLATGTRPGRRLASATFGAAATAGDASRLPSGDVCILPHNRQSGDQMFRLILGAALAATITATAVHAQQGMGRMKNPQKWEKCRELARERGFLGGGKTKGAIKPKDFMRACMHGQVS